MVGWLVVGAGVRGEGGGELGGKMIGMRRGLFRGASNGVVGRGREWCEER